MNRLSRNCITNTGDGTAFASPPRGIVKAVIELEKNKFVNPFKIEQIINPITYSPDRSPQKALIRGKESILKGAALMSLQQ